MDACTGRGWAVALLASVVGCAGTGASGTTPRTCDPDPQVMGATAFRGQAAEILADDLVQMRFTLADDPNQSPLVYTSTPTVLTNLGDVVEKETRGPELRVLVLAPLGVPNGEVELRGWLSADFAEDVDRCPFRRRFVLTRGFSGLELN